MVFDLDDTLIVSTVDYARFKRLIIDRIAATEGDDPSRYSPSEGIVSLIGRYRETMKGRGESTERIAAELAEFDRIMDGVELERIEETKEIPGARELLTHLKAHEIKIGILTRGCEEYVSAALAMTDMTGLVDAVECRNSSVPPKPSPEPYWRLVGRLGLRPEETVFVGDHTIDLVCAKQAGVPFVGVMTGNLSEEELMEAGSVAVFESVAQMAAWTKLALKGP
ncbi:MAG: HAD family hydrolase [Methanobacteriota archaeon]|nr:MAG: HAD family hydrolase [Euryarchaeota archaeon]